MKNITQILVALLFPALASAQISRSADVKQNRAFVYTGKLVRPDGSTPSGNVAVSLKIYSPDPSLCLLWAETQTVSVKEGGFSLELGHAVNRLAGSPGGAAADFKQVFVNNSSLVIGSAQCASGTSYTPTAVDDRLLTAAFNDGGTVVEIAGLPIKSVPFALQAEEIAGFGIANIAKISGSGSAVTYTPAEVQTIKDMLGGDLHFDMKARQVKNLAPPTDPNDAATKAWVSSQISASGGGTVTEAFATAPLQVTNGASTPTFSMPASTNAVDGYLTAADHTAFASKLSSVAGQTLPTGQVWIGDGSNQATAGNFGIGQMRNNVGTLQMPTSCTAAQTLTWSAVTDVLSCTNIAIAAGAVSGLGGLADNTSVDLSGAEASGTLAAARFPALTGEVTTTSGSLATTIINNAVVTAKINDKAVTYAKIQDVSTNNRILGRGTAGAGVVEEIMVGSGLTLTGTTLTAAGSGGTITSLTGEVTASGTGAVAATVVSVGGSTAANVNTATVAVNTNATDASTASVLVKRDVSGNSSFKNVKLDGSTSGTITIGANATTTPYSIKFPADVAGSNNSVLASDTSGNLTWINLGSVTGNISLTSQVTGVLPVANGGTNSNTALSGNRLMVSSATAIVEAGAMTNGQIVVGSTGAAPQIVTMSQDVTITNTGVATVGKINNTTVSGVGLANNYLLQNNSGSAIAGNSVLVSNGTATGVTSLSTPVSGVLISTGGSVPSWATIATDTFTQYALLAGRSGGQVLRGGTAASNTLTLESTSDATKGHVLINPTGGNVGIGTTSPSELLDVVGNIKFSAGGYSGALWNNTTTGAGGILAHNVLNAGTSYGMSMLYNSYQTGNGASTYLKRVRSGYYPGRLTMNAHDGGDNGALNYLSAGTGAADSDITNFTSRLFIRNSDGNVGIGTTSPSSALEVNGTATVQASVEAAAISVNTGGTYPIPDLTKNIRRITLNNAANTITLPVTTGLTADMAYSLTIRVKQDATGSRPLSWGSGANTIKWDSGSTPAVATPANTETIYQFMIIGGETVWYGSQVWKEN